MTHLLLSILASTIVLIIFRMMKTAAADTRHSIVVSYLVSALTGVAIFPALFRPLTSHWLFPAAVEGVAFYAVFTAMARTAQTNGIAVTSMAAKMSVIIPVMIGLLWIGEDTNPTIIIGVLAGLISVLLSAGSGDNTGDWKWPVLVFIGTGLIDASFKVFQVWGLAGNAFPGFITTIFVFAFAAGAIHHLLLGGGLPNSHSIRYGIALGLANFGTVYFFMQALATPNWPSSVIYPLNNFGIVASSTVVAVMVFKERLRTASWIGLLLATLSIALLYAGSTP